MPDHPSVRDPILFPEIEPYTAGRLAVDSIHTLYWEACGRPGGVPVVFLHGGPGGGCLPHHRRYFDPAFWRIVLVDQRGAGRSTPIAELAGNTTQALVADLERLRTHLRIDRWLVFGGSWGSTLALAYAQAHAERCLGLVLRGIFLAQASEIDWFMHGMRNVFPEAWRGFSGFLPEHERADLLGSYYRRLTDPSPAVHLPAAHAWDRYEGACSTLLPGHDPAPKFDGDAAALAIARIEAHYFVHGAFLADHPLLADVDRIRHLPCTIVQGRYDIVCPSVTADALARAWPEAEYVIVPDAGHSVREPGITRELVAAVERMKTRLGHSAPRGQPARRRHQRASVCPPSPTRNAVIEKSSSTSSPISGNANFIPKSRRIRRPVTLAPQLSRVSAGSVPQARRVTSRRTGRVTPCRVTSPCAPTICRPRYSRCVERKLMTGKCTTSNMFSPRRKSSRRLQPVSTDAVSMATSMLPPFAEGSSWIVPDARPNCPVWRAIPNCMTANPAAVRPGSIR